MEVIPAIDLRDGKVVRLYQGDFRQETVFSDDPVAVALRWQELGAPRIHVVDLDGARSGRLGNMEVVEAIAARVKIPLQVGGGVRDLISVERLVRMGAQRVVLGTAAVRDSRLVRFACNTLGRDTVVVGLDARDGKVTVQGWSQKSDVNVIDLAKTMVGLGVGRFIYTDVATDGTLTGPNVQAVAALKEATGTPIIASGGVSSLQDLERLAEVGVEGVIVGSALYRGLLDLREAVKRFGG